MYIKRTSKIVFVIVGLLLWRYAGDALHAQSIIPQSEQAALLEIYDQCGGSDWASGYNWRTARTPADYTGVLISGGHVQGISLDGVGLTGQLPKSFFTSLPELRIVSLSNNKLSGPIPQEFGEMTQLMSLMLSGNLWTGDLPNLNKLVNLRYLHIANLCNKDSHGKIISEVKGDLPDISQMPELTFLDASFSYLTGQLPEQIGKCKKLQVLELSFNKLSGHIPTSISECTELQILSVQNNEMSGEIPDLSPLKKLGKSLELGLGQTEPGRLYLNHNKFTGPFPESILQLQGLMRFSCADNQFTGSLPRDLRTLGECEAFFADHNQFTGELPQYLPAKLWYIDVSHNQLTGSVPATWRGATELGKVSIHHNNLSGIVPPIYKKLANMDMIDLSACRFSFADLNGWSTFIKNKDCIFRFGIQQAYSGLRKESVSSGSDVAFDATYPGSLIGDEHYRWYNLSTLQPVPEANGPRLTLSRVSKEDACRYVCLITSVKMGSTQARSSLRATNKNDDSDVGDIQPTLRSGFWELTVDSYFNGPTNPDPMTVDLQISYDRNSQQLQLCGLSSVGSLMVVDLAGAVVLRLRQPTTSLYLPLSSGVYIALVSMADGGVTASSFIVP